MLYDIDDIIYHNQTQSVFVWRPEELSAQNNSYLCKWIGINEEESLYTMTAQGKKWWATYSRDYKKDGMDAFEKLILRNVGSIFSENDELALELFLSF